MKKYFSSVILKDENCKDEFYENLREAGFEVKRADNEFLSHLPNHVGFEMREEEILPLAQFLQKSNLLGFTTNGFTDVYNWDCGYLDDNNGYQYATYYINDKVVKYFDWDGYKSFDYIKAEITPFENCEFKISDLKEYLISLNNYLSVHLDAVQQLDQDAIVVMNMNNLYKYSQGMNGQEEKNINLLIRSDILPLIHWKLKKFDNKKFCLNCYYGEIENDVLITNYCNSTISFYKNNVNDNLKNYLW